MVMMNETGGNTCQKGDGFVGGVRLLCKKGTVVRQKVIVKDKYYTVICLTNLNREPIICIIIIAGLKSSLIVETDVDIRIDLVGTHCDINFMRDNVLPGKKIPDRPTCEYKGRQVPCLVKFY